MTVDSPFSTGGHNRDLHAEAALDEAGRQTLGVAGPYPGWRNAASAA